RRTMLRIGQDIEDMNRPQLKGSPSPNRATPRAKLASLPELSKLRRAAIERTHAKDLAVESVDESLGGVAELRRVLDERIEHWLKMECRAADDLEHFARRGLLLQRLLGLVEQPDVLDGDHRLVGERLE